MAICPCCTGVHAAQAGDGQHDRRLQPDPRARLRAAQGRGPCQPGQPLSGPGRSGDGGPVTSTREGMPAPAPQSANTPHLTPDAPPALSSSGSRAEPAPARTALPGLQLQRQRAWGLSSQHLGFPLGLPPRRGPRNGLRGREASASLHRRRGTGVQPRVQPVAHRCAWQQTPALRDAAEDRSRALDPVRTRRPPRGPGSSTANTAVGAQPRSPSTRHGGPLSPSAGRC